MRKIWKWRWTIFIILVISDVIGVFIAYYFVQNTLYLLITVIIIQVIMPLLYKLIIRHFLKEIEEKEKLKEKDKEKKLNRYNSIKRMIELLEKYEEIKSNEREEMECTQELGDMFPGLEKIKFGFKGNTAIKDNNYEVIFKPRPVINKFLVRKLINRMRQTPDIAYFSNEYPQSRTNKSNVQVLIDFIKYLKERIGLDEKPQEVKDKEKKGDLQKIINLLKLSPKPDTIFTDIILLFHKDRKLLHFLHSRRFIMPESVQMENNRWSFFTICRLEKSMIEIKKAHEDKIYIYREDESEKNPKIRDEFIDYILSK